MLARRKTQLTDPPSGFSGVGSGTSTLVHAKFGLTEAYAKVSLKKYKPMAARNEDRNVSSGLL